MIKNEEVLSDEILSEVETLQSIPNIKSLGGHTNLCLQLGNVLIKKIVFGDIDFMEDAYSQLFEKKLFGITSYQRFNDLLFLPFIEGDVTEDITVKELMYLSDQIKNSGLKPKITVLDVFAKYNYVPDKELYAPILNDLNYVCHGDLAYINMVKTQNEIIPIDWEFLCYSSRYWDLACFLASLYVYQHADGDGILAKTEEVADPRMAALSVMLLCEYWVQWSLHTDHHFYPKELQELRDYIAERI